MIYLKDIHDDIKAELVPKIRWYLRYRTQIWSTVFMIVGLLGGSVVTIQTYVPTLKYDTEVIEEKLQQVEDISKQLEKLQESVDRLSTEWYNNNAETNVGRLVQR